MDIFSIFVAAFFTQNLFLSYFIGVENLGRWTQGYSKLVVQQLVTGFLFLLGLGILWPLGEFLLFPAEIPFLWALIIPLYSLGSSWLMDSIIRPSNSEEDLGQKRQFLSRGLLMGGLFLVLQQSHSLVDTLLFGVFALFGFYVPLTILYFIQRELARRNTPEHFQGIPALFILAGILSLGFSVFQDTILGGFNF